MIVTYLFFLFFLSFIDLGTKNLKIKKIVGIERMPCKKSAPTGFSLIKKENINKITCPIPTNIVYMNIGNSIFDALNLDLSNLVIN